MMKIQTLFWLALLPLTMGAGLYRWVDDDGVVTFSQTAPRQAEGRDVQRIDLPTAPDPDASTDTTGDADEQADESRSTSDDPERLTREVAERDHRNAVAAVRRQNCERAELMLAQLEGGQRLIVQENDAEPRMLSDEERNERLAGARHAVAEYCTDRD
jgi:hypothetical protein